MKYALILFIFLTNFSQLQSSTWNVNPDHSELSFKVPYLIFSNVSGRFTQFEGHTLLDETKKKIASLTIKIHTKSIFTANKKRDSHLKSIHFFHAKKFPYIFFNSNNIKKISKNHYRAIGDLEIKGVKKIIKADLTITNPIKDTWEFENLFVKFNFKIDRTAFNIKWNKSLKDNQLLIGNMVDVFGVFQLQPKGNVTPSVKHKIPDTKAIRQREKLFRGEVPESAIDPLNELEAPIKKQGLNVQDDQKNSPPKTQKPQDIRKTLKWQLCFYFTSFFGFIAVIVIMIKGKKFVIDHWPSQHKEYGLIGIISDLIVYPLGLVYFWALWIVGFSSN